jgi:E3 ubiquitin-protein ligase UBR7
VTADTPDHNNKYNHNFQGRFCACGEQYDPDKEKGTMFQCLGLGTVQDGGCGEDWWHPECLMGLPRSQPADVEIENEVKLPVEGQETAAQSTDDAQEEIDEAPLPPGFPAEDDFDHLICYKCVNAFPWIKQYAAHAGFLGPISNGNPSSEANEKPTEAASQLHPSIGSKRSAEDDAQEPTSKKVKAESAHDTTTTESTTATSPKVDNAPIHTTLSPAPTGNFSLFLKEDFRSHMCRCPDCFPKLKPHPQLLEEEEAYEPPVSESDAEEQNGHGSVGSGSTYERGEALLSNMDRVKAIGTFSFSSVCALCFLMTFVFFG